MRSSNPEPDPARRRLLQAGAGLLLPACATRSRPDAAVIRDNPFRLGVASGEPGPDRVVLWTRLAPEPTADESGAGGMPLVPVAVRWVVAEDPALRRVVQTGIEHAEPEWAHSLHVLVEGLRPGRTYWYAFRIGDWQSTVGRTRTAPDVGEKTQRLRFAFASCQHYETGYYAAYRHMAQDAPDLILHLGDYIYEGLSRHALRRHETRQEATNLASYRRRYAHYRGDPDLQAAHAIAPWLVTWDDHEVDNDYAGLKPHHPVGFLSRFRHRRAAAYQAYWEHMPLSPAMRPQRGNLPLFRRAQFGDLLRVHLLDTRQYRSDQPCQTWLDRGGRVTADCAQRHDPERTLLGTDQEAWFQYGLQSGVARWNLIAQSMLIAPLDQRPGAGEAFWTDGWDGYPAARDRLLRAIEARAPDNPVTIAGDIHSFWTTDLYVRDPAHGPPVATEFVGTSISSAGMSQKRIEAMRSDNPHVRFADSRYRGYVLCEVEREHMRMRFRALRDVRDPASEAFDLARFVVEAGRAGTVVD